MIARPYRTNATTLTDDELILMDALFDKDLAFRHLQQEDFRAFNFAWRPHEFSNPALQTKIDKWLCEGILRQHVVRWRIPETYYGLTPAGGALWEAERTPEWRRYARIIWESSEVLDQKLVITVYSPSKVTARKYFEAFCRRESFAVVPNTLRVVRHCKYDPIPYKRFPQVIEWQFYAVCKAVPSYEEREREESKRVWWTGVHDLQTFLPPVTDDSGSVT